jgi:hypothetical protein
VRHEFREEGGVEHVLPRLDPRHSVDPVPVLELVTPLESDVEVEHDLLLGRFFAETGVVSHGPGA